MANSEGIFVVFVSTVIALGAGLLIAGAMLGIAKLLIRLGGRSAPPRIDDPDLR